MLNKSLIAGGVIVIVLFSGLITYGVVQKNKQKAETVAAEQQKNEEQKKVEAKQAEDQKEKKEKLANINREIDVVNAKRKLYSQQIIQFRKLAKDSFDKARQWDIASYRCPTDWCYNSYREYKQDLVDQGNKYNEKIQEIGVKYQELEVEYNKLKSEADAFLNAR